MCLTHRGFPEERIFKETIFKNGKSHLINCDQINQTIVIT